MPTCAPACGLTPRVFQMQRRPWKTWKRTVDYDTGGTAARNLEALMPLFEAPYYERVYAGDR